MPAVAFKCSAGVIPIKECLQKCPNPVPYYFPDGTLVGYDRCLSLTMLTEIGYTRDYSNGIFHTTLLTQPLRQAFLQITQTYAINPKLQGFKISGTRGHRVLDRTAKLITKIKSEYSITREIASTLDRLEPINDTQWHLRDNKFVGTYTIAKMLKNPPDYSGYDIQCNGYRAQVIHEAHLDIPMLSLEYIARDWNTRYAQEVPDSIGIIPIPIYPLEQVDEYFERQRELLQMYLAHNEMPPLCEDRWVNDRRCKEYCDGISSVCPHGMKYIEAKAKREASKNGDK